MAGSSLNAALDSGQTLENRGSEILGGGKRTSLLDIRASRMDAPLSRSPPPTVSLENQSSVITDGWVSARG